jgi:DNA modification methylase
MSAQVFEGDCLEVMANMPDNHFDAIVTDPPYHFTSIVKRFGKEGAAPAQFGTDGAFARASRGFMGKEWDGGDIAFRPETWAEALRIMKPGAHLVAFGAPKNYHRLACAIEDAGFEIRDSLMWVFGSGFPKSHNLDGDWKGWGTALKPAYESIVCAAKPLEISSEIAIIGSKIVELEHKLWSILPANVAEQCFGLSQHDLNAVCASAPWSAEERSNTLDDLRAQMDMSRFASVLISSLNTVSSWKSTLVGNSTQESMSIIETELKTITDWRTLKSLLSKITPRSIIQAQPNGPELNAPALHAVRSFNAIVLKLSATLELSAVGNAILQEAENCRGVEGNPNVTPIVLARKPLSEKTVAANVLRWGTGALNIDKCRIGTVDDLNGGRYSDNKIGDDKNCYGAGINARSKSDYSQPTGRWPANLCHDGSQGVLDLFPHTKSGVAGKRNARNGDVMKTGLGAYADDWGGYDDEGSAARFFYCPKASKQDRAGSKHPTVKPINLMRWLIRMVTPPNGLILDPFGGSGTTGAAAMLESVNAILIEREAEYIADINRRLSAAE